MKKLDGQYIAIAIMMIIMVASFGGTYYFADQYLAAKQEIENSKVLIIGESNQNSKLVQIKDSFQAIVDEGYVEKFPAALPDNTNFIALVEELERIAELSGGTLVKRLGEGKLTEDAISIENKELARAQGSSAVVLKGDGYAIVQIQGTLRVRFDGLVLFLRYLNDSKYFINIDGLFIRRVIVDDGPDQLDVGMVLNAYVKEVKGL